MTSILQFSVLIFVVLGNVSIIPMKRCFKEKCLTEKREVEEFKKCFRDAEKKELEGGNNEVAEGEADIYDYYDHVR